MSRERPGSSAIPIVRMPDEVVAGVDRRAGGQLRDRPPRTTASARPAPAAPTSSTHGPSRARARTRRATAEASTRPPRRIPAERLYVASSWSCSPAPSWSTATKSLSVRLASSRTTASAASSGTDEIGRWPSAATTLARLRSSVSTTVRPRRVACADARSPAPRARRGGPAWARSRPPRHPGPGPRCPRPASRSSAGWAGSPCPSRERRARTTSVPERPGMPRSRTTRPTLSPETTSRAASPLAASSTTKPARRRASATRRSRAVIVVDHEDRGGSGRLRGHWLAVAARRAATARSAVSSNSFDVTGLGTNVAPRADDPLEVERLGRVARQEHDAEPRVAVHHRTRPARSRTCRA